MEDWLASDLLSGLEKAMAGDVSVDAEGRPVRVLFQRWSNANLEGVHRLQPFGAVTSDFRYVGGYRLPFRVEAGNMFGTDDYFPFFRADVTEIRFPGAVQ